MSDVVLNEDGHCEVSDLPPEMCSHCRKLDEPPKAYVQSREWVLETEVLQPRAFYARYRGWCDECDSVIMVGMAIAYSDDPGHMNSDGKASVVHQDCR